MPKPELNRRRFLKTTGVVGTSFVGIGTVNAKKDDPETVRFVSIGVEHDVDTNRSDLLTHTVDQIKGYRIDKENDQIHIQGRPDESILETFIRNDTVVGFNGYQPTPAELEDTTSSIVTELGDRHRVLKEIVPAEHYSVPNISVNSAEGNLNLLSNGRRIEVPVKKIEGLERSLPAQNVTVKLRQDGETEVTVTPKIRVQNYGNLTVIDDTGGGER